MDRVCICIGKSTVPRTPPLAFAIDNYHPLLGVLGGKTCVGCWHTRIDALRLFVLADRYYDGPVIYPFGHGKQSIRTNMIF